MSIAQVEQVYTDEQKKLAFVIARHQSPEQPPEAFFGHAKAVLDWQAGKIGLDFPESLGLSDMTQQKA